jgi:hypothetical protein
MTRDDFRDFVEKNSQEQKTTERIDWSKQREEFLSHISRLYLEIQGFLKEFIDSGKIVMKPSDISLSEEFVGSYKAPRMTILIGNKEVTLTPIGTNLIAAKGRIDMKGRNGIVVKIVLVDSRMKGLRDHIKASTRMAGAAEIAEPKTEAESTQIEWKWRLLTAPPTSKYLEMNESNFLEALMELAHD